MTMAAYRFECFRMRPRTGSQPSMIRARTELAMAGLRIYRRMIHGVARPRGLILLVCFTAWTVARELVYMRVDDAFSVAAVRNAIAGDATRCMHHAVANQVRWTGAVADVVN